MKKQIRALINNCRRRVIIWPLSVILIILSYAVYPCIYHRYLGWNIRLDISPEIPVGAATGLCALLIAAQGFGYLHSTSKVDMYHSLPVSMTKRFWTIYIGGLIIFFSGLVLSVICGLVLGRLYPYRVELGAGTIMLRGLLVLLYFLCIYNVTVFSFSITGNTAIAVLVDAVLIVYVDLWQKVFDNSLHFETYSTFFAGRRADLSIVDLFFHNITDVSAAGMTNGVSTDSFLRGTVGLLIWFIITFIGSKRTYVNRPSETSESLVAFYSSHLLIKLMIVVPVALLMGESIYESFYNHKLLMQIIGMIVSAYVTSAAVEFIFTGSVKSALKSVGSVIFSLFVIFAVFACFRYAEDRFDSYIPKVEDVESFAIYCPLDCYYYDYNIEFDEDGRPLRYIDASEYVKENMILYDTEAVITLAKESADTDYRHMGSPLPIQVYYRLNNGVNRKRLIWVDMDYPPNRTYLNRLMGPAYYKSGVWQVLGKEDILNDAHIYSVEYHDVKDGVNTPIGDTTTDAIKVINAWKAAMVMYDYDHVRLHETVGELEIHFGDGYHKWLLPVYEDMYYSISETADNLF